MVDVLIVNETDVNVCFFVFKNKHDVEQISMAMHYSSIK